jgi:hypothetical protein
MPAKGVTDTICDAIGLPMLRLLSSRLHDQAYRRGHRPVDVKSSSSWIIDIVKQAGLSSTYNRRPSKICSQGPISSAFASKVPHCGLVKDFRPVLALDSQRIDAPRTPSIVNGGTDGHLYCVSPNIDNDRQRRQLRRRSHRHGKRSPYE